MKITAPLFLVLLMAAFATPLPAQGIVLLETFENDNVGGLPGSPDVGGVLYNGIGTRTVTADFGGKRLRSVDALTDTAFGNQWAPIANPAVFEISYLFRLESATGDPYFTMQTAQVTVTGSSTLHPITLRWNTDGTWGLSGNTAGSTFVFAMDYQMRWWVDCSTDRVSITANGVPLFTNLPIGVDCTALQFFAEGSTFPATTSEVIDDVKIINQVVFSDGFESGGADGWSSVEPPPLAGDECTNAINLADGVSLLGDLTDNGASGATDCGALNTLDEWLVYLAPCTGEVTVSTCHPATNFDSILSAFDSCSGSQVACNDDADGAPSECELDGFYSKSTMTFSASAASAYYLRVSAYQDQLGTSGSYEIRADCAP